MSPTVLLLLLLSSLVSRSIGSDTITPTQPLADGQTLVSPGGSFALGFFSPGTSKNRYVGIWYNKITQTVVWVANRQNPVPNSNGTLSISADGSLVITGNSTTIWSSPAVTTGANHNPVAQLLDNGNFVVRDEAGPGPGLWWQSFDYPTDTLLPEMKLGWNLTSGLNRSLTSWKSGSDPSLGSYCLSLDLQGDPQVLLKNGPDLIWRAGPWDGIRFTGIADMKNSSIFNFTFVKNTEEVYYTFHVLNNSIISRLVANGTGTAQRLVWVDEDMTWNVFWYAPKDQCDHVSPCGNYGVCDANNTPNCRCLQGFDPKSPDNWALHDGRDGCVRRTSLDCHNGTDGFVTVPQAKLPDTTNASVDLSMGLDECRKSCLGNCSCTAYASADIADGGNSGCIHWFKELTDLRVYPENGQDLYVRLAAADLDTITGGSSKKGHVLVIILVCTIVGALLLGWISCFICRKKKRTTRATLNDTSFTEHYKDETSNGDDLELPLIDIDTIMTATNMFSVENKIGQGGFGPVYKGKLGEQDIAVKRLAKTSVQGVDEFKNEVVLIAKLQHRNLVRLLGCCVQGEERMLIYEYMPNKSLDAFLFEKEKGALLDWQTRYHIIVGIARGLLYLHQDSRFRIIHRDLKASNILLDKEMIPKISDFGLARMFGGDETEVNTKKVVGTYGYMSPEYAMDGIFSVKSDVFSFGVLVLEIISGKKNRGFYLTEPNSSLLGNAWSLWNEEKALDLVDASISNSLQMIEVIRCIRVGLLCVQERPEDRPTMSSVVPMLASENPMLPNPKQPGFVKTRGLFNMDSSSSKQESVSVNETTVTIFEGR